MIPLFFRLQHSLHIWTSLQHKWSQVWGMTTGRSENVAHFWNVLLIYLLLCTMSYSLHNQEKSINVLKCLLHGSATCRSAIGHVEDTPPSEKFIFLVLLKLVQLPGPLCMVITQQGGTINCECSFQFVGNHNHWEAVGHRSIWQIRCVRCDKQTRSIHINMSAPNAGRVGPLSDSWFSA